MAETTEQEKGRQNQKNWMLFGKEARFRQSIYQLKGENGWRPQHPVPEELRQRVRAAEEQSALESGPARLASAGGQDIERLAVLDNLTELLNTRSFVKELKDEIHRSQRYRRPLSLCMVSIDRFAELVEEHGPLTSDAVLRVVAGVVRQTVRDKDIAAVFSEHEIAVIFPETTTAEAAVIAEQLRDRIGTQAISHNWQQLTITASLGLASFPNHAPDYEELIARTLQAMAVARARGGDRVCAA